MVRPALSGRARGLLEVEFCPQAARIVPVLLAGDADFVLTANHFVAPQPGFAIQVWGGDRFDTKRRTGKTLKTRIDTGKTANGGRKKFSAKPQQEWAALR